MLSKKEVFAVSTLMGTIIGAGVLGIPYVVTKSGYYLGLFHLIFIASIVLLTMLYLGEISLRTKTIHQLTGYAKKYLGKIGRRLMLFSFIFGIFSALLAYLIGESKSLSFLIFGDTNSIFLIGIILWLVFSLITFFGLKAIEEGEVGGVFLILALILGISIIYGPKINLENLQGFNLSEFFTPFGVIIFAYLGFSAIPELRRILKGEEISIKKIVIFAMALSFLIYLVFTTVVIGFNGNKTPEIATLALGWPFVILGMITMLTSYLALSLAMIDSLRFDYEFKKNNAWLITSITPVIIFALLYLTNNMSFTKILGIGGTISGGITAVLILLMAEKAKLIGDRKPEYKIPYSKILTWSLGILFAIGTILEVASYF